MKRSKKILAFLCCTLVLAIFFVACGSATAQAPSSGAPAGEPAAAGGTPAEAGDWTWERKIDLICPWGTGGGADTTLRAFQASLEKVFPVPIEVKNIEGAGGATGVDYAIKQPADGYTWVLNTQSTILAQLTGATEVKIYENLIPVTRLVHDVNIFVANANAPYNNYEELMAYLEENPNSVGAGCMSVTGLDGLSIDLTFDGKVKKVAYTEGSQLNADIMGGHVQLGCVGPAEVLGMLQSGDMKVIVVCAEERMTMEGFEDAECTGELGIDSYYGPARGVFCAIGTPQAAIDSFAAYAEQAVASPEFQDWCKQQGLDQRPGYMGPVEYLEWWDGQWEGLKELLA